ncbi:Pseudouridine synthase [Parasponia andersonii]|uniref:Pseudouridine synthase n=1 Tax=Parasponia andersonii TaxID=3476 RepID=A0A2P5CHT2_PARAD|nr:Pseudouridine synthase [Parasponia andersonii]
MENPDTETTRSPPPSPDQEPDAKKLKMSTTTTSDDEDTTTTTNIEGNTKKQRYKRRKVAIFFAYCGVGYQGMQKNPGAKTIEGDLEEALYHSGAVPEQDRNNPKRYDWARSARTDKGVSAVGQVVSGRFYVDPPGFIDRLNSNLSPQIRIFGYRRVTASFNAKKFCDRRRYVYLIPVFALDPNSHPNRETVMASLGSENELVKCLECSERGRKVVGVMGKRNYELRGSSFELGISSNNEDAGVDSLVSDEIGVSSKNGDANYLNSESTEEIKPENGDSGSNHVQDGISDSNAGSTDIVSSSPNAANATTGKEEKINSEENPAKRSNFFYGDNVKERFNRILKYYEGTHNFHNFTTRTKAEDPAARRFIVSFNANIIVTVEGMEFVKCEVVGQSFMLHQIRKMIGLAVAIMRNCAPESLIEKALQKDVNINVPTAPEVGLYLDECFFSSYNKKWKDSHEELSMKAYEQEAEDFKMKHIYTHIASTEHKEGVVALWLHSLNHRNYPDLRVVDDGNATNKISTDAENMVE